MTVRYYSSTAAETTLSVTINSAATTMVIGSAVGLPALTPFTMSVDYEGASEELVDVTNLAGTTLTITRAIDGTSATTHNAGARVRHVSSARDFADSRAHENATTGVHGLAGGVGVVGTSTVQTLSGKTLTSPTINTPTINGPGGVNGVLTFGGAPTFQGGANITTLPFNFSRGATTNAVTNARVTGDTQDRLVVQAGGALLFGSGTAVGDTDLHRSAANTLATDDNFAVGLNLTVAGAATVTGNTAITGNLAVTGIGQELFAYKTADTSRGSTVTTTDDPHLTVTVSANAVYKMECAVIYSGDPAGDLALDWTVPVGGAGFWLGAGYGRGAVDTVEGYTIRMNQNTVDQARTFGALAGVNSVVMINGLLRTAGTGGTFALQWAQAVSDVTPTSVRAESYLSLHRVQ